MGGEQRETGGHSCATGGSQADSLHLWLPLHCTDRNHAALISMLPEVRPQVEVALLTAHSYTCRGCRLRMGGFKGCAAPSLSRTEEGIHNADIASSSGGREKLLQCPAAMPP